jgi:hypothetical protein
LFTGLLFPFSCLTSISPKKHTLLLAQFLCQAAGAAGFNNNMKKQIIIIQILLLTAGFTSCSSLTGFEDKGAAQKSRGSSFIELKDGSVLPGKELRLPRPLQLDLSTMKTINEGAGWVAIDDRKVDTNLIYGYQDKGVFYAFIKNIPAKRHRKGRINLYSFETQGDNMAGAGMRTETQIVFEKKRGVFAGIYDRLDYFYEHIIDNAAAAVLCKELFPYLSFSSQMISSLEKLQRVVHVYNQ